MDASALSKAAAALESAIKSLESRSDSLENWLKFWITLVVIGVVLEVAVVIAEYCHRLRDFRRGTIRSPERPTLNMFVFELFAVSLVAIGVSGELGIDFLSRDVETKLRTKNRELTGLFQGASSTAIERASNADERSKLLENENLKLRERLAWRTFSKADGERIVRALAPFKGQPVDIWKGLSDPESNQFGTEIKALLTEAGWVPRDFGGNVGGPLFAGVSISVHHDSARLPAALRLVQILRDIGVRELSFVIDSHLSPDPVSMGRVVVFVGRKPFQ